MRNIVYSKQGIIIFVLFMINNGCTASIKRSKSTREEHSIHSERNDIQYISHWWKVFYDPYLNDLEQKALNFNQDIRSALASVQIAQMDIKEATSRLFPRIYLRPGVKWQRISRNGFDGSVVNVGQLRVNDYNILLNFEYDLDAQGEVRKTIQRRKLSEKAEKALYEDAILSLSSEIAKNYFYIQELDGNLNLLQDTIKLREELLILTKQQFETGVINELNVFLAETEVNLIKTQILEIEDEREKAEKTLAVLCGQKPSELKVPKQMSLKQRSLKISEKFPSELIKERPDVQAFEHILNANGIQTDIIKRKVFPSVRITGDSGVKSIHSNDLLRQESQVWSGAINASLTILDGGEQRAQLKKTETQAEKALKGYEQYILNAFSEGEIILQHLNYLLKQMDVQEKIIDSATKAAELSRLRYQEGRINYFEVMNFERSRLEAKVKEIELKGSFFISIISLVKSVGGRVEQIFWGVPGEFRGHL